MKIEKRQYTKLINASNILLTIAAILSLLSFVSVLLIIIFQKTLVPLILGVGFIDQFIFPTAIFFLSAINFGIILLFSILLIKKDMKRNKSILIEVFAFLTLFFMNVVSYIVHLINNKIISMNYHDYIIWYSTLTNLISRTSSVFSILYVLYYIGVTIKLTLTVLRPIDFENNA